MFQQKIIQYFCETRERVFFPKICAWEHQELNKTKTEEGKN